MVVANVFCPKQQRCITISPLFRPEGNSKGCCALVLLSTALHCPKTALLAHWLVHHRCIDMHSRCMALTQLSLVQQFASRMDRVTGWLADVFIEAQNHTDQKCSASSLSSGGAFEPLPHSLTHSLNSTIQKARPLL